MYKSLAKIFAIIDKSGVYKTHEEQREIVKKYQETGEQKYKDLLLGANYRSIYKHSSKLSKATGCDPYDLFIEGCFGLISSIDTFDINSKNVFYTYAVWYIKKYMFRFVEEEYGKGLHIPANVVRTHSKDVNDGVENKINIFSVVKNGNGEDVDPLELLPQDTFISGVSLEEEITN